MRGQVRVARASILVFVAGCTVTSSELYAPYGPDARLYPTAEEHTWSRSFPGSSAVVVALAVDGAGDVFIAGSTTDEGLPLDFGSGPLVATRTDAWIAKLAGEDGSHRWSRLIDAGGTATIHSLATLDDGSVVVAGDHAGTIDLGAGPMPSVPDEYDAFVARYRGDGTHVWGQALRDTEGRSVFLNDLAAADDLVYVAVSYSGSLLIEDLTFTSSGASDSVILALDEDDGAVVWAYPIYRLGDDVLTSIAAEPGRVVAAGHTQGLQAPYESRAMIVVLGPDGQERWIEELDSAPVAWSVALVDDGGIVVGGTSSIDGGRTYLEARGADGREIWAGPSPFTTNVDEAGALGERVRIAVDASGHIVMAGGAAGLAIDPRFGAPFVAIHTGDGLAQVARAYWGDGAIADVAAHGEDLIVTGVMREEIDFGGGPLPVVGGGSSDDATAIFVAKVRPPVGIPPENPAP